MTDSGNSQASARVAIITGAAQGIGKAISLRLADDGLDIVVNDIPSKNNLLDELVKEIEAKGRRSIAVTGDVTKEEDVQNLVTVTVEKLGSVDVMVANAGRGHSAPLLSTTVEEWDSLQDLNVKGVFLCYREAAKQMIKQGRGGRIIGAASLASKKGSALWGAYCTSKFAVRGLTQSAAAEFWPHGITVNAYAPGLVRTNLWNDVDEARSNHGLTSLTDKIITTETAALPVMDAEDIAGLVSYIARPESKFVTGQSLNINGGSFFD